MARKKLKGIIKRISGKNTVAVEVVRVFHHPRYRKRILTSKVYLVHVADGDAPVGKSVTIEESRPISKTKRWVVVELDGKSVARSQEPVAKEKIKTEGAKKTVSRRRKGSKK
ncbi:MAG: 30S ribosomal protein S17, small subunit ribosomal protein S17 [candidate division WWE3 bacterium CSP1-7]|uniref:30S ribosomal protein S17, chloroplastic n=1 Tax=candidate division WWE3 bacterium CSP1-7 TaxID=1576480 RepID=A0A0T5ZY44_UNCKA|nr:MAG: 30S ribosomal protein S17, small subunit ribosomal protein S17 [candidate division WWE3 bacterium CSP1-7]